MGLCVPLLEFNQCWVYPKKVDAARDAGYVRRSTAMQAPLWGGSELETPSASGGIFTTCTMKHCIWARELEANLSMSGPMAFSLFRSTYCQLMAIRVVCKRI